MSRPLRVFALILVALLAAAAPASARSSGDRTVWFQDVTIQPGETVNGDLNVLFGNATIGGTVNGDVHVVGGTEERLPSAVITGTDSTFDPDWMQSLAPWVVSSAGVSAFAEQNHRMMLQLTYGIVVVFMFLLFPMRVRMALERVERHPGLSAAVGTLAIVAVLPVAILLVLSLIGIPLVVLELAAVFAGIWLGQGAIALLVGRRLCELVSPRTTPSPLAALILGLVVVSAAEIVPVVGWAVTALVWLVGLGAAILAFVRETSFRAISRNAPIGGPPMNPA